MSTETLRGLQLQKLEVRMHVVKIIIKNYSLQTQSAEGVKNYITFITYYVMSFIRHIAD